MLGSDYAVFVSDNVEVAPTKSSNLKTAVPLTTTWGWAQKWVNPHKLAC